MKPTDDKTPSQVKNIGVSGDKARIIFELNSLGAKGYTRGMKHNAMADGGVCGHGGRACRGMSARSAA